MQVDRMRGGPLCNLLHKAASARRFGESVDPSFCKPMYDSYEASPTILCKRNDSLTVYVMP